MIDAIKFAKPLRPQGDSGYRFGLNDPSAMAAELRRFADQIERGEVLIQGVQAGQVVAPDEYPGKAIFIEYYDVEKRPSDVRLPPPRVVDLPSE